MTTDKVFRLIVALAATSAAVADEGSDRVSDTQAPANASASVDTDSMASFRAVVASVLAIDAADASDAAAGASDSVASAKALLQRNLGTGFGHGTGNAGARPPAAASDRGGAAADSAIVDPGAVFALPYRDSCAGNGHLSSSAGAQGGNTGFGSGDCGDPSPAD